MMIDRVNRTNKRLEDIRLDLLVIVGQSLSSSAMPSLNIVKNILIIYLESG